MPRNPLGVLRHHGYAALAFYGDTLRRVTWVTAHEDAWVERQSEIRREADGSLLARARSRSVWVEGKTHELAHMQKELAAALACRPARESEDSER